MFGKLLQSLRSGVEREKPIEGAIAGREVKGLSSFRDINDSYMFLQAGKVVQFDYDIDDVADIVRTRTYSVFQ